MCVANELKLGGETVALIADNELDALRFAAAEAAAVAAFVVIAIQKIEAASKWT